MSIMLDNILISRSNSQETKVRIKSLIGFLKEITRERFLNSSEKMTNNLLQKKQEAWALIFVHAYRSLFELSSSLFLSLRALIFSLPLSSSSHPPRPRVNALICNSLSIQRLLLLYVFLSHTLFYFSLT